jgi:hypothetical protein
VNEPELRAGDADRERVARALREAHAEGRLDLEELSTRLDAALAARTLRELAELTADLPADPEPPIAAPSLPAPTPASRRPADGELRAAWTAWAIAVSANVVIWVLVSLSAGDAVYFWPMWVAGPWGAVLAVLTVLSRPPSR